MERRWITPKECAEYLSIHVKTVYTKISIGTIPAGKLDGLIRVDKRKLDEILETQERLVDDQIERLGLK